MKITKEYKVTKYLLLIFLLSIFFVSLLSMLSYSPEDDTLFKSDSSKSSHQNLLDIFGSSLADLIFRSFGLAFYIFPLIIFSWIVKILVFKKDIHWISITIMPLTILSVCLTLALYTNEQSYNFPESTNGFVGIGLKNISELYTEAQHTNLTLMVSAFMSILMLFITLGFKIKVYLILINNTLQFSKGIILLIIFIFSKRYNNSLKTIFNFKGILKTKNKKIISKNRYKKPIKILNEDYTFPILDYLEKPINQSSLESENQKNIQKNTIMLGNVLEDFNIKGSISSVKQGPIVTLYELTPAPGTKTSTVIGLADDIARSMSSISSRISAIPGRDAIGIEIPNKKIETVFLRELFDTPEYKNTNYSLPLVLGKNILGKPVIVDLATMPHLLVAGTTGSGKSVGINAMILSLLYHSSPEECRLILIDPKMLELSIYQDIPHLLTEVVTDPKKAIISLKWAVKEMESRYHLMTLMGVREIEAYNERVKKALENGETIEKDVQVGFDQQTNRPLIEKKPVDLKVFPKIVLVVDELADLMITAGREIEAAIQRLSQMARAAGIHLIVATQRPSVDVITGTIKSNFPSRISYQVTSKIDSRTILGEQGGEQLLGKGDLLLTMIGKKLLRVHGPFVKTHEVESVVKHIKKQGEPEYLESITQDEENNDINSLNFEKNDELYNQAVAIVCREKKASTSFVQRHLQIGYNRAARMIEKMENDGIISPANHVGRREVLVGKDA